MHGVHLLMKHLLRPACYRRSQLHYLGQDDVATPCGGCDVCAKAAGYRGPTLGPLPYHIAWVDATDAALRFLNSDKLDWSAKPRLTQVLEAVVPTSPAPFDTPEGHDLLVFCLLSERTIVWDAVS